MCVIMYKPAGMSVPSLDTFKACFEHNPHGAGYMLPLNGKVTIRKGFMNLEDLIVDFVNFVKKNKLNPKETPVVFHFRISTQGGIQRELCHPFPVASTYSEMRALSCEANFGLAHNGIISLTSENDYGTWDAKTGSFIQTGKKALDHNDTMKFIRDYGRQIIDDDLYFARNKNKCDLLKNLIDYSKLAIMNRKGFVKLIGDFYKVDGIYYSNLHHFPKLDKLTPSFKLDSENL